jgi:hypothetical protein
VSLNGRQEVTAMGGPWRERVRRGVAAVPQRRGQRSEARAHARQEDGLGKVVLGFIAAVLMSFGVMLSLLHHGW